MRPLQRRGKPPPWRSGWDGPIHACFVGRARTHTRTAPSSLACHARHAAIGYLGLLLSALVLVVSFLSVTLFQPMRYRLANFTYAFGAMLHRCSPRCLGSSKGFTVTISLLAAVTVAFIAAAALSSGALSFTGVNKMHALTPDGVCSHGPPSEIEAMWFFAQERTSSKEFTMDQLWNQFWYQRFSPPTDTIQVPLVCDRAATNKIPQLASIVLGTVSLIVGLWTIADWRHNGVTKFGTLSFLLLPLATALLFYAPLSFFIAVMFDTNRNLNDAGTPESWHPCRDCGSSDAILASCATVNLFYVLLTFHANPSDNLTRPP